MKTMRFTMISKRLLFTLIFLMIFLLHSDALRRGGSSKSRIGTHTYSAGNLSNESPKDPGRAILAIIVMILSCGGGIGWKIYNCYRNKNRQKLVQPRLPYPNSIFANSMLTSTVDQLSETDLSPKRSTLLSLSAESLQLAHQNALEEIQVTKTTSKEENARSSFP